MEQLPVEIWEEIFAKISQQDPVELRRLRLVCKTWKKRIDEYWSRSLQLCSKIPKESFNDIAQALFPLSAKPWQKLYWKSHNLPYVPRGVCRVWKNLPKLKKDNLEITTSPISLRNSELYPHFAMNDKYLAVSYGLCDPDYESKYGRDPEELWEPDYENYRTSIYKLSDLENPFRSYELYCKNLDFYTVGTKTFIILHHSAQMRYIKSWETYRIIGWTIWMDEFETGSYSTCLYWDSYAFVDNECFSFSGLTLTHKIFTGAKFIDGTRISVPREGLGQDKEIKNVRIEGSELQVLVSARERGGRAVWIFRYNITREPDETLSFTPIPKAFMQKVGDVTFPACVVSRKNPMDVKFCMRRQKYYSWFEEHYSQQITTVIVHANYIITGTDAGKIFIFHRTINQLKFCISRGKTCTDYVVIDLKMRGFKGSVAPVGLAFIDSKPRLIVDAHASLMAIDFL